MTSSDLWDADTAGSYDDASWLMFSSEIRDPTVSLLAEAILRSDTSEVMELLLRGVRDAAVRRVGAAPAQAAWTRPAEKSSC